MNLNDTKYTVASGRVISFKCIRITIDSDGCTYKMRSDILAEDVNMHEQEGRYYASDNYNPWFKGSEEFCDTKEEALTAHYELLIEEKSKYIERLRDKIDVAQDEINNYYEAIAKIQDEENNDEQT